MFSIVIHQSSLSAFLDLYFVKKRYGDDKIITTKDEFLTNKGEWVHRRLAFEKTGRLPIKFYFKTKKEIWNILTDEEKSQVVLSSLVF